MDAIVNLTQRVSVSKLSAPAPSVEQCDAIYRAALRAADHGNLRPWRFLTITGDDRQLLGQLFRAASLVDDPAISDEMQAKILNMPMRAPMVIVAIAKLVEHPKVPKSEMMISAGACVQNMLNAAFALGVGAYWRTGTLAYHSKVKADLGLVEGEEIVGYLYLGTPDIAIKAAPTLNTADFFQAWPTK